MPNTEDTKKINENDTKDLNSPQVPETKGGSNDVDFQKKLDTSAKEIEDLKKQLADEKAVVEVQKVKLAEQDVLNETETDPYRADDDNDDAELSKLKREFKLMNTRIEQANAQAEYVKTLQAKDRIRRLSDAGLKPQEIEKYIEAVGGMPKFADGVSLSAVNLDKLIIDFKTTDKDINTETQFQRNIRDQETINPPTNQKVEGFSEEEADKEADTVYNRLVVDKYATNS